MTGKYYVVAGNYTQFHTFIKKKAGELWLSGNHEVTLSHFVYVSGVDQLRGISNPTGWFYGTWYERTDIRDILAVLTHCCINDGSKLQAIDKMYDKLVEVGK